jgi:hypothetical protein
VTATTTWRKGKPVDGLPWAQLPVLVARKHSEVIGRPEECIIEEGQPSGGRDVVVVRAARKVSRHSVVARESVSPSLSCCGSREKLLSVAKT